MDTTALKLRCVACGHENQATDNACASCGSTLNLRICTACEAINSQSAETCHACGAACAEGPATVVEDAVRVPHDEVPRTSGRMPMLFEQPAPRPGYRMVKFGLLVLPAVALAYGAGYFYRGKVATPIAPDKQSQSSVPKVAPREVATPTAQPEVAPPKVAATGAGENRVTGVTHTRRADAPASAAAAAAISSRPDVRPVSKPIAAVPDRAPNSESPPARFVTHTRAQRPALANAPMPAQTVPAASAAVAAPATPCAEPISALGLCKAD